MPNAANWASVDLSAGDALVLTIGDATFPVAQCVISYALNELPTAVCMLAVGRDARSAFAATPAAANAKAGGLQVFQKATITCRPRGDYSPTAAWPDDAETIFDGRYVGSGFAKFNGKVYFRVHLVHWLVDLTCSSTLSANSHPANPYQMTAPAVFDPMGATGSGQPVYLSEHVGHQFMASQVASDLWGGYKDFLLKLAAVDRMATTNAGACDPAFRKNDRAAAALNRIEGPGTGVWAHNVPLQLQTRGISLVADAVANALSNQTFESAAAMTFWDAIVGVFSPMFNAALVPLVATAVVVADTPAYRTPYKTITPEEYDSADVSGMLSEPLRAVGVYGDFESVTRAGMTEQADAGSPLSVGGCYVSPAVSDQLGTTRFIAAPVWLRGVTHAGVLAPYTSGVIGGDPIKTAFNPEALNPLPPDPTPADLAGPVRQLYSDYAHAYFVANALRGRTGPLSGKLRFDIAPGSIVRVRHDPERFLAGVDALAEDYVANVGRVTIAIAAESRTAATSFTLTHLRTETENGQDGTSVDGHPLFGRNVYNGAPLVDAWSFNDA